jgi:uncharacterized protein
MPTAPLANMITLGVRDFAGERNFYRNLGWSQVFDSEDFVVFELGGALLALFPLAKLAADAKTEPEVPGGGIRFSVIISVEEPSEVDEIVERARQAGARITKEPVEAEFFSGRDAYFADPENNFWEVAWAPKDNPVVIAAHRAAGLATGA